MKITDNFLQNCLYWLTEISLYTRRINQMQKELHAMKSRLSNIDSTHHFEAIQQQLQDALNAIQNLECSIIFLIKDNSKNPINKNLEKAKIKISNEDELFEQMKKGYNVFVELQRSFNAFFKETEVQKTSSKVIDLQKIKRMTPDIEKITESAQYNKSPQVKSK